LVGDPADRWAAVGREHRQPGAVGLDQRVQRGGQLGVRAERLGAVGDLADGGGLAFASASATERARTVPR